MIVSDGQFGLTTKSELFIRVWRVLHGVRSQTDYPDTKSFQKRFFAQSIFKVDVRIFGVEQKKGRSSQSGPLGCPMRDVLEQPTDMKRLNPSLPR